MRQSMLVAMLFVLLSALAQSQEIKTPPIGQPAKDGGWQNLLDQLNTQTTAPNRPQIEQIGNVLDAVHRTSRPLAALLESAKEQRFALVRLAEAHDLAVKIVQDPATSSSDMLAALRLLACGLGNDREDRKILAAFLKPQTQDELQVAALQQLGRTFDPSVPGLMLATWKSYSPKLRGKALDVLLGRSPWTHTVLEAMQKKQLPPQEIDAEHRQVLFHHQEEAIRVAARKIFASAGNPERGQVVDDAWLRMPDKSDKQRGSKLFAASCVSCHPLMGTSTQLGPDLAYLSDRSPQALLAAILDPTRAIEPRYLTYQAVTKSGTTYTGVITSETSTHITVTAADGKKTELLRTDLDTLASTGKSLMPEGFEKSLSPQDLADIIEHLRASQQPFKRKVFPGNEPLAIGPNKEGELHLPADKAALHGPRIVFEKSSANITAWSSPEDNAVWTVEVATTGVYRVWVHYACANDSAGNTLALRSGEAVVKHKIGGTGSWENYYSQEIGELQLTAGSREIILRAEGTLRHSLLDLKGIKMVPK